MVVHKRRAAWFILGVWLSVAPACGKRETAGSVATARAPELVFGPAAQANERAPIALTTSDGAGLTLVSVQARTVIEDPLAFTELHLVFRNPEDRRREGRFRIALPEDAAISRFAMRVGDDFQEGEVVERLKAQQVYEDFLHRKQDPALLENAGGNEFSARVFPIEANADKEIIVAYSEELAQRDQPYRLFLAGLPSLSSLKVEVLLGSSSGTGLESSAVRSEVTRLAIEKRDFAPRSDLEVRLPKQKPFALRSGDLVVARVRPMPKDAPEDVEGLTVLFDTSASRALGFAAQIERLAALLNELARSRGRSIDVRVVAFDQTTEEIYRGPAGEFGLRDKGKLLSRDALGATDLNQALTFLADQPDGHARVLLVSDGMVTAGDDDMTRLREAVARLSAHGVTRFDVLAEGSVSDAAGLAALTHVGSKGTGVVLDARAEPRVNARRMLRSARDKLSVDVPGATWVHPRVLEAVQAGDERLVFAEIPEGTPVRVSVDGAPAEVVRTLETPRPLLERAAARAKIAALTLELKGAGARDDDELERKREEIVALSKSQRVLSDYTALLVLESDWDYRRFGLAQDALTSILRVGEEGLELFDRARPETNGVRHDRRPVAEAATQGVGEGSLDDAEGRPSRSRAEPEAPRARAEAKKAAPVASSMGAEKARASDVAPADSLAAAPAPAAVPASPAKASSAAADGVAAARGGMGASGGVGSLGSAGSGAGGPVVLEAAEDRPAPLVPRAVLSVRLAEGIAQAEAASAWRGVSARARSCYARAERRGDDEHLALTLYISERGTVRQAEPGAGNIADPEVRACLLAAARAVQFPKPAPERGAAIVQASVELAMVPDDAPLAVASGTPKRPRANVVVPEPRIDDAYAGDLAAVLEALHAGEEGRALSLARAAHERDPGDVLALVALGEVLEAQHDHARAARVYGSLIDLFPTRADLRRMAGERLERLGDVALALVIDTYRKAVAQRPDHPAGHRLLAYALLKQGQRAAAFAALERALDHAYPGDRFPGVDRILREDLGLVAAAWLRTEPDAKAQIEWALARRSAKIERAPSLRFVLNWETDANDVDFHIHDGRGGHASYLKPKLPSGGALYADVTTGYGPECFTVPGAARAYPYVLQAHYFARGPMGYGMGKLEAIAHDGKGGLSFHEAPFVIMKDKAFVELFRLTAP